VFIVSLLGCMGDFPFNNFPPNIIEIDSPTDGEHFNEGDQIQFSAAVDNREEWEQVFVQWASDIDGNLFSGTPDSNLLVNFTYTELSHGKHTITVTATDAEGEYAEEELIIEVNGTPSAASVSILPSAPTATDNLNAQVSGSLDPDGDSVIYSYRWFMDGVDVPEFDDELIVPSLNTAKNQIWRVEVTPSDQNSQGPTTEAEVRIQNTPPSLSAVHIVADYGTANGNELYCSYTATDTDCSDMACTGDEESISPVYTWTNLTTEELLGISSVLELVPSSTQPGDIVSCSVTVIDDSGAESSNFDTVEVENSLPYLLSASLHPDPAFTDDTIYCQPGTAYDPDGEEVTEYSFAWKVDGIPIAATEGSLPSTAFEKDQEVTCLVWPIDGTEEGDFAETSITISNSLPTIAEISIVPEEPYRNDTLFCSYSGYHDKDGDPEEVRTEWYFANYLIGSTSKLDLSAIGVIRGDSVECLVTANDGTADGNSLTASATVVNSPPTISSINFTPVVPNRGDTIVADFFAYDIDGDSVLTTARWYLNFGESDEDLIGLGNAIDASPLEKGTELTIEITASDTLISSERILSVVLQNAPPNAPEIQVLPEDPIAYYDDVYCEIIVGSEDADGDDFEYVLRWYLDDELYDGSETPSTDDDPYTTTIENDTLPYQALANGEWSCNVYAYDAEDEGAEDRAGFVSQPLAWSEGELTATDADIRLRGTEDGGFGEDIASVADLDGDGLDELLISAPTKTTCADAGCSETIPVGEVYLFLGSTLNSKRDLLDTDADIIFVGEEGGALGSSVAHLGDIDNDGLPDIALLSAEVVAEDETQEGDTGLSGDTAAEEDDLPPWSRVYVFLGSSLPPYGSVHVNDADIIVEGVDPDEGSTPLFSLIQSADLDGDSRGDLIIASTEGEDWRRLDIFLGASLPLDTPSLTAADSTHFYQNTFESKMGTSMAALSDVDGDGREELLIGAEGDCGIYEYPGGTYVLWGADIGSTREITPSTFLNSSSTSCSDLGSIAAMAGDTNGDGHQEILLSSPKQGVVYLMSTENLIANSQLSIEDLSSYAFTALYTADDMLSEMGPIGDLNQDGKDDFAIGAEYALFDDDAAGRLYFNLGASFADQSASLEELGYKITGKQSGERMGASLAHGADFNGDGLTDFAVGAPGRDLDGQGASEGAVDLWLTPKRCQFDEDNDGEFCQRDCNESDPSLHRLDLDGDGVSSCQGDCDDDWNYQSSCEEALTYSAVSTSELNNLLSSDGMVVGLSSPYAYRIELRGGGGLQAGFSWVALELGDDISGIYGRGSAAGSGDERVGITSDMTMNVAQDCQLNGSSWTEISACTAATSFAILDEDGISATAYLYIWMGSEQPISSLPYRRFEGANDDFGHFTVEAYEVTQ
jgi:hypothetical protein